MAFVGKNKWTLPPKSGGTLSVSTIFSVSVEHEQVKVGRKLNPSREAKLSSMNEDREMLVFLDQLRMSSIDKLYSVGIYSPIISDNHR